MTGRAGDVLNGPARVVARAGILRLGGKELPMLLISIGVIATIAVTLTITITVRVERNRRRSK